MDQLFGAINISNVKPIRDIVYESLRKAIMDGKLQPGERIVEKDYAEKMNISRTPIREALRKLEIEGLIEYIPRKGVVVNGFNHDDIIEIYAIRRALEGLAMKYVVEKITDDEIKKLSDLIEAMESSNEAGDYERLFDICKEFNESMLGASKMPKITGLINTMQEYLERFRRITMSKSTRRASAIQEHKAILQAIIDKDAKRAEKLVYEHLEASQKVFFDSL